MDTAPGEDQLKRLEITEIFHSTIAPIVELPALVALLEASVQDCSAALDATFALKAEVVLERMGQQGCYEALGPCSGMIGAIYFIAEWNARAVVAFDATLLFRALDTMYGGDGRQLGEAPKRDLSGLERSVADQLARAIIGQFQARLAPYVTFGCSLERVERAFDAEPFGKDKSELVVAQMLLEAFDERIVVALPARGLELVRDQIAVPEEEAPVEIDPSWSRNLAESIGRTEIDLVAVAAGPALLLGEVAALRPGSVIEFDAKQLERVRIESDGEPIFEGQLGQQKGYFSICLEAPVAAKPDEAKGPPARRRA
ncbi:MAG: FliM/FliN family flagellar motor switch protein [Hyphomicrobiaceae bacterium]